MMKNVRNIAALLLVLTGLIHLSLFFDIPQAPEMVPVLVFGILYAVIGALVFRRTKYSAILGIAFPALGILGGLFLLDPKTMDPLVRIFLLLIDLVIIACCVILLLRKETET